jgi:predicted nucleotide-binding protein
LPRIDADLLAKLKKATKLSQSRVYALIDTKVQETSLPRNVAALLVAPDWRVNFSRFASEADLAMMRGANSQPQTGFPAASMAVIPTNINATTKRSGAKRRGVANKSSKKADAVFVVHERNTKARDELTHFLRSLDIKVIEWSKAVALTKKPNPYIGEVIDAGFLHAQAIVVLLTADDEAKLKDKFITASDHSFERKPTGQPRQNVLFEAGMAFGRYNATTVLVRIGDLRPMSDVAGIHILHLSDTPTSRKQFVSKLKIAGVVLNDDGDDWLTAGDFDSL